jgi:hypothetical protein
MEVYHFTTTKGDELKVHPKDVRHIEYHDDTHHEPVATLHLRTTGTEYDVLVNHDNNVKINNLLREVNGLNR